MFFNDLILIANFESNVWLASSSRMVITENVIHDGEEHEFLKLLLNRMKFIIIIIIIIIIFIEETWNYFKYEFCFRYLFFLNNASN